jgi:hypothetical protein
LTIRKGFQILADQFGDRKRQRHDHKRNHREMGMSRNRAVATFTLWEGGRRQDPVQK